MAIRSMPILQALLDNAHVVLLAVGAVLAVLAVLNFLQLLWGRPYIHALREHEAELRQLRMSMQQLDADRDAWLNKLILMTEQLPETLEMLQLLQSAVEDTRARQAHWNAVAEEAAAELNTLMESGAVKEIIAESSRA